MLAQVSNRLTTQMDAALYTITGCDWKQHVSYILHVKTLDFLERH